MGITKEYKKYASLQTNKIAIKENDRVLTFKEWFESVCKVANWLNEKESQNKTIAIVLENSMEFLQLLIVAFVNYSNRHNLGQQSLLCQHLLLQTSLHLHYLMHLHR